MAVPLSDRASVRDLSQPVHTDMTGYPGDPAVLITPALTLPHDGVAVAELRLGSHAGTHLDAPAHTVPGGRTTGFIGLEELTGEALVIHLPELPARSMFGLDVLDAALAHGLPERVPAIVVVHTGWARYFDTPGATEHPALETAAAADLVRRGMHLLAVDTLSPDPTRGDQTHLAVHTVVLGSDRLIVENLTNLDGLPESVRIGFFPLAIDTDGAPVRAIAFDLEIG